MKIDILTTFPHFFDSILQTSILGRAVSGGILDIRCIDIRDFSASKHKNTDDYPFGGGAGMLMMAQPASDAIKAARSAVPAGRSCKVIYMSPKGKLFTQEMARMLSREDHLILLCGHYEGIDQRVIDRYTDLEVSIGDYILTGGELPAIVMTDCIARLIPGVLGSAESAEDESFSGDGLLEYPQYTRPRVFEDAQVPDVLLSGNHAMISQWRYRQSLLITEKNRPDLLTDAHRQMLEKIHSEETEEQNDRQGVP
ncbi:MAG: tRNA (guanosine(37)-N1)-methyltransferase TrmD [Clostridia bacterium]|nr:tRNA (guanosine(37)-N1)-methyltransferase TrmD [Clostridia bacterium]